MTYSLLDRIHGAFWGVAIAHQLTQPHHYTMPYLEAITEGVDWVYQLATGDQSATLAGGLAIASESGVDPDWEHWVSTILPLLIYDANDRDQLTDHLLVLLTVPHPVSDGDANSRDGSTLNAGQISQIMGAAIAHALQSSPLDLSLIDVLEPVWPVVDSSSPHPLAHLHTWLSSPTSLAMVTHNLNAVPLLCPLGRALLLALYCSLSSAGDSRLALLRASRRSADSALATLLTGAILGANQGCATFPTAWKRDCHIDHAFEQLAANLLAIRAGVYGVTAGEQSSCQWPRVIPMLAAPGIFHP